MICTIWELLSIQHDTRDKGKAVEHGTQLMGLCQSLKRHVHSMESKQVIATGLWPHFKNERFQHTEIISWRTTVTIATGGRAEI